MKLKNTVHLIAYPHRIGGNLATLAETLESDLSTAIGGVHILPFYPSNGDGGFSPLTHKEVDPSYGSWEDIEKISGRIDVCADLVMNHISDESPEFLDFIENGFESEYADLFINIDDLEPISEEDKAKIHIRMEKDPFVTRRLNNGKMVRIWATFYEHQIDLNYLSPKTFELMRSYLEFLAERGIRILRLDAFGYTTKKIGSSCFLVEPEVFQYLERFRDLANSLGMAVLPEVHGHPEIQYNIADRDMYAYGFALAPHVLYAYLFDDVSYLAQWISQCPHNQITVLDTHDGICLPDAEDILSQDQLSDLANKVKPKTGKNIVRKNMGSDEETLYQLNCTYFEALDKNEDAYVGARAIQLFVPGIPQIYYAGLVAEENQYELWHATNEGREINRPYYTLEEWREALSRPVSQRILRLLEFRNSYPAFDGECFIPADSNHHQLTIRWEKDLFWCQLDIDVKECTGSLSYLDLETNDTSHFTL